MKKLISVSSEVHQTQWPSGELEDTYIPHTTCEKAINSISLTKNGEWLVLVPSSGTAEIISLDDFRMLLSLKQVKNATCAAFRNSTKRQVLMGTEAGQLLVYDVKNKLTKKVFPKDPSAHIKVEYNCKDSHVVAACNNGELFVYNENSMLKTNAFKVPKSKTLTTFMCHNEKKHLIGGCSEEGVVVVWDTNTGKNYSYAELHNAPVRDLVFREDVIISVSYDRRICFFDYTNGNLNQELSLQRTPSCIDLASDGYSLAVGFCDGGVAGYDLRNFKESMKSLKDHPSAVRKVRFLGNGNSKGKDDIVFEGVTKMNEGMMESDSFGQFCCVNATNSNNDGNSAVSSQSKRLSDSFIDAFVAKEKTPLREAVDGDGTTFQVHNENGVSITVTPCNTQKPDMLRQVLKQQSGSKLRNSTPITSDFKSLIYENSTPITSDNANRPYFDPDELKRIIKESIREVVQEEMQELKREIKMEISEMGDASRRQMLGLQMYMCKESIKIEEHFGQLKSDLCEDIDQQL